MKLELTDDQRLEITASLRRYFRDELERELSQLESKFLLEYLEREIAPLAYNQGIRDAQRFVLKTADDLPGTCFEEPLTFWSTAPATTRVRRKPAH